MIRFRSNFRHFDTLAVAPDTGTNQVGQICLANEARFNAAFLSEPLTAYSTGWSSGEGLEEMLELLAPEVPVSRRFSYRKAINAESFLGEDDNSDIRAIGAEFKQVAYRGEVEDARTYNKGLTVRIDRDEEDEDPFIEERYAAMLMSRLQRMEIRRSVALHEAAATNQDKTWGTATPVDADMDLLNAIIAGADTSGIRANRVAFGENAWSKRLLTLRASDKSGAIANSAMTPNELAGFLAVDKVFICKERVQATKTTKRNLLGNNAVYLYHAISGANKDDPSNIKRFVTTMGGGKFRVYRHEVTAKLIDITVEHYSNIIATSTLGVRKLTIN